MHICSIGIILPRELRWSKVLIEWPSDSGGNDVGALLRSPSGVKSAPSDVTSSIVGHVCSIVQVKRTQLHKEKGFAWCSVVAAKCLQCVKITSPFIQNLQKRVWK